MENIRFTTDALYVIYHMYTFAVGRRTDSCVAHAGLGHRTESGLGYRFRALYIHKGREEFFVFVSFGASFYGA